MPIPHVEQPEIILIDDTLRLRRYDGLHDFALSWYQDTETLWLVDGVCETYDMDKLRRMYAYLDQHGELYWIEMMKDGVFQPVGDVTFWQEDMPIVIGEKALRGCGVGRRVIRALAARARALGWQEVRVAEIYRWNEGSRRCFESVGFVASCATEKGFGYRLSL